jgi:2-oxoisovalerate dehydrogenase E1 component alpha subunit
VSLIDPALTTSSHSPVPSSNDPATSSSAGAELVQLLTPEGERISHPEYDIELTDAEYRELYRDLVLVRRIDVEATALQRQGELGIWAALLGQEAAQVGSGRALRAKDFAFPTYREHGVAWCKGVDPVKLLGLFRGASNGGWDPQEKRFNLYTIVIGSQTLHATGYAMGVTKDGAVGGDDGEAVIAYFGDGASSQGDVNEAFVWASVYNAPVVFFCQNNQWGISTPTTGQSRIPLYKRAEGFGFPGVRVDGNDVLASYAVTRKALDTARAGQGPTLIEAFTYRMGAHTTSDDPTRYRLASELEAWKLKDPLERMKSFLYKQQLADSDFFAQLESDADALAARIRKECLEMEDPSPLSIFADVYAETTPLLQEQEQMFATYLEGFADAHGEGAHR